MRAGVGQISRRAREWKSAVEERNCGVAAEDWVWRWPVARQGVTLEELVAEARGLGRLKVKTRAGELWEGLAHEQWRGATRQCRRSFEAE